MNTNQSWKTQRRVEKGVSNGGEWREGRRDAPPELGDDNRAWQARGLDLAADAYVPAVLHRSSQRAGRTGDVDAWWNNHFASATWNAPDGEYPKMPDDYTPGDSGGRALSGSRHTHRMRYGADGVDVRMPSKTSIRRFARDGHRTFDVPFSTTNSNGNTISGWARVTGPQAGMWDVQVLHDGRTDRHGVIAAAQAREIITATLEGRRCTVPVSDVGELVAHARRERAARGVDLVRPKSTWIKGLGYDDAAGTMIMRGQYTTKDGVTHSRVYGYATTRENFARVASAQSPGAAFTATIKHKTDRVSVARCPSCGLYTTDIPAHRCRIERGDRSTSRTSFETAAHDTARDALAPKVTR